MTTLTCDFCGKRVDEVQKLIAGTNVGPRGRVHNGKICNECIALVMAIMAKEEREWFDKQVDECRRLEAGPTAPEPSK
jgi:ATP-dependent protease Clp ATPase subunit